MSENTFGKIFSITSFGESHGKVNGIIIDGVPSGIELNEDIIQEDLDKRKPGQSQLSTSRKEKDKVEIISGIFKGKTTGAPICLIIENEDKDSSIYEQYKDILRPSHADFSALKRYGGFADYRGSGRFSGRITAGFVMAGAVARKILKKMDIQIFAYTKSIGNIKDNEKYQFNSIEELINKRENNNIRALNVEKAHQMENLILKVKSQQDSIGGIIKCVVLNLPPGIGSPVFETIEGKISKAIFAIPAVKGIEFGAGFKATKMKGSEHNDPWIIKDQKVRTSKNDSGGIIGGISNGMPIEFQVAIKPTPTIGKSQNSVNIQSFKNIEMKISGRHDPCIVPRAIVVVEAMTAIVLVDLLICEGRIPRVFKD
ncbi:MAG: Chorismate synthase [Promethearchaeota archaeon]|nr:MAG: Chorismate synthase [Candidatus Lokiarchaeota archaeon]